MKNIYFMVFIIAGLLATICGCSYMTRLLTPSCLQLAGAVAGWVSGILVGAAIAWRAGEALAKLLPDSLGRFFSFLIPQRRLPPVVLVCLCLLSAGVFQMPVVGAQVGALWQDGHSARTSAIAGVMPFADAKQFYSAGISMPITGKMYPLPARRPIHAANLATLFVLAGYYSTVVLLAQAAFCGFFLAAACFYLSRICGPPLALAVWALVLRLSQDMSPCFMSEGTGLWLGLIGACLFLAWVIHRRPFLVALSLGVLVMAFSARSGAIFILPAIFIIGLWDTWRRQEGEKTVRRYLLATTVTMLIAGLIPCMLHAVYNTGGGAFQGNASYILYELAVGGEDWQQIFRDYPDELKRLKTADETTAFIYARTKEALFSRPKVFFSSVVGKFHTAFEDMPYSYFLCFLKPSALTLPQRSFLKFISIILFYAGMTFLLVGPVLAKPLRKGLLLLLLGFISSLPFIWVTFSVRFQAVTWLFAGVLSAGILGRRGNFIPPFTAKAPVFMGVGAYIWVVACVFIPWVHQAVFPFDLKALSRARASTEMVLKEGERIEYIVVGPHTPALRMRTEPGLYKRPDIAIREFSVIPRIIQAESLLEPYHADEQLMIALDLPRGTCRYYWSEPFCMPDRPWVMRAVVSPQSPPHVFRLRDVVPVDFHGRPLDRNRLPYGCLYSSNNNNISGCLMVE